MLRISMVLVAMVPLAGLAAEGGDLKSKMNLEELQKDAKASDIVGTQVQGANGQEAGDVEDIVIGKNGRIEAVLVNTDNQMFGGGDASQQRTSQGGNNQDASQQRTSQSGGRQASIGKPTNEEGVRKVRWSQVNYDPSQETLSVTSGSGGSGAQQQEASTRRASAAQQSGSGSGASSENRQSGGQQLSSFRVSDINGMEVHLEDAKSFGSVEDVLVDPKQGKATALLVDAWEGLDKQTYTLPVEIDAINNENDSVDYRYTESEVIALQEYEDR